MTPQKPATKDAGTAGVSDSAVNAATGKTWAQWITALDKAGAAELAHKDIVKIVAAQWDVTPWWQQMVVVGYEQAKGLRVKHQKTDGFSAGASKVIAAPVAATFKAFHDGRTRAKWLPGVDWVIRTSTPDKSMRITWTDGRSSVNVNFYAKSEAKCQVALQHDKLASAREAETMKTHWRAAVGRLAALLEKD